MKLTKIITGFILASGLLLSCGVSNEQKHEMHEQETKEEHHQENNEARLSLNNGAKWEADEPTYNGMKQLKVTIILFKTSHNAPGNQEYNALGNQLGEITKEIISKCSMKGPDHDKLHIVLAPMLANIDVIKNETDLEASIKNIEALEASLEQFFAHFELK
ncbi:MAG: hypothetical protein L3J29_02840 [Cyclobacteriaceae bacterium]|nr:hypothetical protein [Cyclobacteriaceae bacterium]